jgi:hypothetical protein
VEWTPVWPEPPPAPIDYDAVSSVFDSVVPPLPASAVDVQAKLLEGPGSIVVSQFPDATNNWTLIVRFANGSSDSAFLKVRLSIDYPGLRIARGDKPGGVILTWPTSWAFYHLESASAVAGLPGDWTEVTNKVVRGDSAFSSILDSTLESGKFFRLRKP